MFTIVLVGKVKQCLGLFITQMKFAPRLKRLKLCNFLGRSYSQSVSYLVNISTSRDRVGEVIWGETIA